MKRINITGLIIVLAAGSIVSGCSSTEQTAENMAAQRERCRSFGYPEGSRDAAAPLVTPKARGMLPTA